MPIEPDKRYIGAVLKSAWFYVGVLSSLAGLLERWFALHLLVPYWAVITVFMLFLSLAQFEVYKKQFNEDQPKRILETNRRRVIKKKLAGFTAAEKDVLKAVLYGGGTFGPTSLPDGLDENSIMPAINKATQTGLMERNSDGKIFFSPALEPTLAFMFENEDAIE
jgi:hypothetical protein